LVVVSLIAEVLVVLTRPFTRNMTTPTMRRQATVSVTTISTIVKPSLGGPWRGGCGPASSGLLMV
jgi:hypothetical protein